MNAPTTEITDQEFSDCLTVIGKYLQKHNSFQANLADIKSLIGLVFGSSESLSDIAQKRVQVKRLLSGAMVANRIRKPLGARTVNK